MFYIHLILNYKHSVVLVMAIIHCKNIRNKKYHNEHTPFRTIYNLNNLYDIFF